MLRELGRPERIPEYIARAKDKEDPFRLVGFGHRVYKNYDPRANVLQKTVREVFDAQVGGPDVCTPATNAHLTCRLLLEKNKKHTPEHTIKAIYVSTRHDK